MMYNYPFFSFPYFRRYPTNPAMYYNSYSTYQNKKQSLDKNKGRDNNCNGSKEQQAQNKTSNPRSGFSFLDSFFNQSDRGEDENYFDLFGLKLYNDDLLLIGMIFFLYKEDVKDQYLFIALILLLLS